MMLSISYALAALLAHDNSGKATSDENSAPFERLNTNSLYCNIREL